MARNVSQKDITDSITKLETGITKIKGELKSIEDAGESYTDSGFKDKLKSFLETAFEKRKTFTEKVNKCQTKISHVLR